MQHTNIIHSRRYLSSFLYRGSFTKVDVARLRSFISSEVFPFSLFTSVAWVTYLTTSKQAKHDKFNRFALNPKIEWVVTAVWRDSLLKATHVGYCLKILLIGERRLPQTHGWYRLGQRYACGWISNSAGRGGGKTTTSKTRAIWLFLHSHALGLMNGIHGFFFLLQFLMTRKSDLAFCWIFTETAAFRARGQDSEDESSEEGTFSFFHTQMADRLRNAAIEAE